MKRTRGGKASGRDLTDFGFVLIIYKHSEAQRPETQNRPQAERCFTLHMFSVNQKAGSFASPAFYVSFITLIRWSMKCCRLLNNRQTTNLLLFCAVDPKIIGRQSVKDSLTVKARISQFLPCGHNFAPLNEPVFSMR